VCVCVCADLRRSDTGNYECWAASETGLTRSRVARLSVDAPSSGAVVFHRSPKPNTFPAPPGRPAVSDVTNTTVRLAWRVPGNVGTSPLLGYAVEYFSHVTGQVPVTYLTLANRLLNGEAGHSIECITYASHSIAFLHFVTL